MNEKLQAKEILKFSYKENFKYVWKIIQIKCQIIILYKVKI